MGFLQYLLGWVPSPDVLAPVIAGVALAALTLLVRRRAVVALPDDRARRRLVAAVGTAGSAVVLAASVGANVAIASVGALDPTGHAGWWMRPLGLAAAAVVVAVALVAIAMEPPPDPGARALGPHRTWRSFAPTRVLAVAAVPALLLAATLAWQIGIATDAPRDASLYGRSGWVDLPVWMPFQDGLGYVAGVGWPNHLATAVVLALAIVLLWLALRTDAARPVGVDEPASATRAARASTASALSLVSLGGLLATFGAVWAFVGFTGQIVVGLGDDPQPDVFLGTGYAMLARPIQLAGLVAQAAAVAVLVRLGADTIRALVAAPTRARVEVEA